MTVLLFTFLVCFLSNTTQLKPRKNVLIADDQISVDTVECHTSCPCLQRWLWVTWADNLYAISTDIWNILRAVLLIVWDLGIKFSNTTMNSIFYSILVYVSDSSFVNHSTEFTIKRPTFDLWICKVRLWPRPRVLNYWFERERQHSTSA